MSIIYRGLRVGKNGKEFYMYKIETLVKGADKESKFANDKYYTKYGKFLRKYKIDELPQIWNIIKRDMNFVGVRPEEPQSIAVMPNDIKELILSERPGLTDLASLYFYDEEEILKQTKEPEKVYWTQIKPMKMLLQVFYIKNKCWLLKMAIVWLTIKKVLRVSLITWCGEG